MIKNAIAYITRKKNRTFIIFVILTIVLSCLYSCLTIMKSSNEIEKTLYESSNSSISITKKDGKYFNVNQFKDIEKLKEIEETIIQYDGLAKLKDSKVISGEQKINREDLSAQVPGPEPRHQARPAHQHEKRAEQLGFLDFPAGGFPPGHRRDERPRHSFLLPPHARVRQPCVQHAERGQ